jgi:hypothetical protein
MSDFKGTLVVTMRFDIPVRAGMYQTVLKEKGVVTPDDIIRIEEQNYLDNADDYLEIMGDHVSEVSFDFLPESKGVKRE